MKIAIISSAIHHIECLGFLIDGLSGTDLEITVFTQIDKSYGYEKYFHTLYDGSFTMDHILNFIAAEYDIFITLSAGDKAVTAENKNKTISIIHVAKWPGNSAKKITLSPYVKLKLPHTQIMPVYRGLTRLHKELQKEILWVGQLEDTWIDQDMIKFVKSVDYHFTFIISAGNGRGKKLKSITNATVMTNMSTEKMIVMILKSDMILCRKFPYQKRDRYSGVLSLGISHDKPMIMNKQLAEEYDLPGITFDKNYSELIDLINNMTIEQLNHRVEESIECKERCSIQGKEKIRNMVDEVFGTHI